MDELEAMRDPLPAWRLVAVVVVIGLAVAVFAYVDSVRNGSSSVSVTASSTTGAPTLTVSEVQQSTPSTAPALSTKEMTGILTEGVETACRHARAGDSAAAVEAAQRAAERAAAFEPGPEAMIDWIDWFIDYAEQVCPTVSKSFTG